MGPLNSSSQSPASGLLDVSALPEGDPLSAEERARVLSAGRLRITLIVFVVTVLLALSGMIFSGVSRIFDWLTPSIRQDLQLKTRRGAVELAQTAQLGIVLGNSALVGNAVVDYRSDPDVIGLAVLNANGEPIFEQGDVDKSLTALFRLPEGRTHEIGEKIYAAWMPSEIEGARIGRVAVLVSKTRLAAGLQLRREILFLAAGGCLFALILSVLFVNMYIGPILRVTSTAFSRLERTTEAALTAARVKSQFLANMSHEIRTPRNGILGVLDLLERTDLNDRQRRYTQTIENSAHGHLSIINEVLDFSKLEAGKYELRHDDLELSQMLQEVAELLSPKAHAKKLELIVRFAPDVPAWLRGDVDRIKQVLLNLTGNAIKFTEHGHVLLEVGRAGQNMLRLAVSDTGVGVRREDQMLLFGMFSQVDGSLTRKHGGTGLGLAISKRLVEAMGGEIGVDSEYGVGSTFWFTFPLVPSERVMSAPPEPRAATILVVAKNDVQREALRDLVRRWGMTCVSVASAEEARMLVIARAGGLTAAVIDGAFEPSDSASEPLFDLCAGEGLSVIRLLSTTQMADASTVPGLHSVLSKPVRASELYNGLIGLLEVGQFTAMHRSTSNLPLSSAPVATRSMRARVLVVDDNEINRLVALELLTELGYSADTASNGAEAVARARDNQYDAILMDCQMPELDGLGATAQIRQLPGAMAKVPIIALTAHAFPEDRARVIRGGMDDYTTKPVRARVLDRMLRRWIPSTSVDPAEQQTQTPQHTAAEGGEHTAATASSSSQSGQEPVLDATLPRSRRAVELFLSTVPELVASLGRAVDHCDPVLAKQLAHKLKGNCLSLGALRMAATCHKVEVAALAQCIDVEANARVPAELSTLMPLLQQLLVPRPSNDN
jgi:signal transduction histidine kinase/CheY-like chemotaxis protein